jgi:hypothetical protein
MVFALVDLAKYVLKAGRYSPEALAQMGAFRATPEMYTTTNASAVFGDALFVHPTRSIVSWAIMYLTHGPWSYVGGMGTGTVWEAVTAGVGENVLRNYFDGQNYVAIVRLPMTDDQGQGIKAFREETTGDRYSYGKVVRLFLLTICNEHPDYRLRFTIDILITLGLAILLVPLPPFRFAIISLGVLYLIVLGFASLRRIRAALRYHRDYLEFASPMSHKPINSSPNRLYRILRRQPGCLIAEPFDDGAGSIGNGSM